MEPPMIGAVELIRDADADPPSRPAPGPRSARIARLVLLLVSLVVVAASLTLHHTLFAAGSPNQDDIDYRNQAQALADGELTLDADEHMPSFRPYLTGLRDDRVIFTHQPTWAAVLAVADVAGAPDDVVLAGMILANVIAMALFARELTGDRTTAVIAVVLLALSPIFVVQSATLLAYQLTLALATASVGTVLRAVRTRSFRWALVGGALTGLMTFNRPFDAMLVVVPLLVVATVVHGRRAMQAFAGPFFVGGAPMVALMLAYNRLVMGSPFRFPYTVNDYDTIGFGPRASFISGPDPVPWFGLSEALVGLGRNLVQVPVFSFGGAVTLIVAAGGLFCLRSRSSRALLVLLMVVFPLGFSFWWTSWNTSNFGLERSLGPAYYEVSIAAVAVAAAAGLRRLFQTRRPLGVMVVLAMAVWTTGASIAILDHAARATEPSRTLQEVLTTSDDDAPRLVFTPRSYAWDPYVRQPNTARLDGRDLFALDLDRDNVPVVLAHPDRSVFAIRRLHATNHPFDEAVPSLVRLHIDERPEITLAARFTMPLDVTGSIAAYVAIDDADPVAVAFGGTSRVTVRPDAVSAGAVRIDLTPGGPHQVTIGFAVHPDGTAEPTRYEHRFAVGTHDGNVAVLLPGDPWHRYVFPNGQQAWSNEELGSIVTIEPIDAG